MIIPSDLHYHFYKQEFFILKGGGAKWEPEIKQNTPQSFPDSSGASLIA